MRPPLKNKSAHAKPPPDGFFLIAPNGEARVRNHPIRTMTARTQTATIVMTASVSKPLLHTRKSSQRVAPTIRQGQPDEHQ